MEDKVKKIKEVKEEILLPVHVIISANNSALVEYTKNGLPFRATVQLKQLIEGKVKESVLDKAVKHGIDWRELDYPLISSTEIMHQLRNHGIWTAQDARTKPGMVSKAVMQACSPLVSTILSFIKDK